MCLLLGPSTSEDKVRQVTGDNLESTYLIQKGMVLLGASDYRAYSVVIFSPRASQHMRTI